VTLFWRQTVDEPRNRVENQITIAIRNEPTKYVPTSYTQTNTQKNWIGRVKHDAPYHHGEPYLWGGELPRLRRYPLGGAGSLGDAADISPRAKRVQAGRPSLIASSGPRFPVDDECAAVPSGCAARCTGTPKPSGEEVRSTKFKGHTAAVEVGAISAWVELPRVIKRVHVPGVSGVLPCSQLDTELGTLETRADLPLPAPGTPRSYPRA